MRGVERIGSYAFNTTNLLPCEFPDIRYFSDSCCSNLKCYPTVWPMEVVSWAYAFSGPLPDNRLIVPPTCTSWSQGFYGGTDTGDRELIFAPRNGLPITLTRYGLYRGVRISKLVLAEGITSFAGYFFSHCDCTVVLPSTITSIKEYFCNYSQPNFKLYIKATTPPALAADANIATSKIRIPVGTLDAYSTATNWSAIASRLIEYDFDADPDNINQYCV